MDTTQDIAWLAGIIEGEGCIYVRGGSPSLIVLMTDRDVVERVAGMLGSKVATVYRQHGYKTAYKTRVGGEAAATWIADLYEFLGERRKAKAIEALNAFGNSTGKNKREFCGRGHVMIEQLGNCYKDKSGHMVCLDCQKERYSADYHQRYYTEHREEKLAYQRARRGAKTLTPAAHKP
jgi:hypothetical protein